MATQAKYAGSSSDITYGTNTINVWNNLVNSLGTEDLVLYSDCTIPLTSADGAHSNYIQLYNFGFTLVPDAQVTGIAAILYRYSLNGFIVDRSLKLMKAGTPIATDKSVGAFWDVSDELVQFGSLSDMWNTEWLYSDINDNGFGVQLQVSNSAWDSTSDTAYLDAVRMIVTFTLEDGVKRIIQRLKLL